MVKIKQHIGERNVLLPGRIPRGHLHRSQRHRSRFRRGGDFLYRSRSHTLLRAGLRWSRRHSSTGSRFARAAVKKQGAGDGKQSEQDKRAQTYHENLRR
ncbi:hypothetical protein NSND_50448 [Nitrospira sp. ND1]|nr:hypothetical protein NSND_50448 [Nitrospira sp. ND1]